MFSISIQSMKKGVANGVFSHSPSIMDLVHVRLPNKLLLNQSTYITSVSNIPAITRG